MDETEIFKRLGLALAIGLLFGVERGWHTREESGGDRVAGVRTFALMGLLGGVSGWLARILGPGTFGLLFLGYAALVTFAYWLGSQRDKDLGITTEVAELLVFALGGAVMLGEMAPAAAAAVAATALLAAKSALHRWIGRLQRLELTAALELAIISVVLLPLLPDEGFGPGGALNPYELWWAVVLVAGVSFVGYIAIRSAGAQTGTLIAGLLGGLASSTATTLAFSRMARRTAALGPALAVGAVLAGSIMFLRILVIAAVFNRPLALALAVPMAAMALTGGAGALLLRVLAPEGEPHPDLPQLSNPLELGTALKFGALLAVIVLATSLFQTWFGAAGVYAVAAVSGLTDVDAVTISMARMSQQDLQPAVATTAIVTAASVDTAVKAGIALVVGGAGIGLRVVAVYVAVLVAGGLALWLGT
jgi:uncharacterized membrane protein (DUF4010 family)